MEAPPHSRRCKAVPHRLDEEEKKLPRQLPTPFRRTKTRTMLARRFFGPHGKVLWYVPNLIGYLRVALVMYAFVNALQRPKVCLSAYVFAFVCDELDGRAARKFRQCSAFGAVLDMATDRVSTAGLMVVLAALLPRAAPLLAILLSLDVGAHWLRTAAAQAQGKHHKQVSTVASNGLLKLYYRSRIFMGYCCVSAEVTYLALYAMQWKDVQGPWHQADIVGDMARKAVVWIFQQKQTGSFQTEHGTSLAEGMFMLALPGWALKQVINLLQGLDAAVILGSESQSAPNGKAS